MEYTKTLHDFWTWLPAFRVVAETEHLPTASERLHVSAAALSRTIRLLEDAVGEQLFERKGRNIVLSEEGKIFLRAVRTAMRNVHEGLLSARETTYVGPLHLSVPGPLVPIVIFPVLATMRELHHDLRPYLHSLPMGEIPGALLRGELDVALLALELQHADLVTEHAMDLARSVWASPTHPLSEHADDVSPDELARHGFVAPTPLGDGTVPDGWPLGAERRIDVHVAYMQTALDAVRGMGLLSILPDVVGEASGFVQIQCAELGGEFAPTSLFALSRPPVDTPTRGDLFMELLRESLG